MGPHPWFPSRDVRTVFTFEFGLNFRTVVDDMILHCLFLRKWIRFPTAFTASCKKSKNIQGLWRELKICHGFQKSNVPIFIQVNSKSLRTTASAFLWCATEDLYYAWLWNHSVCKRTVEESRDSHTENASSIFLTKRIWTNFERNILMASFTKNASYNSNKGN